MEVITELVAKLPDMEIDGVMSEEMEARVWELRMPDLPQEEQLAVELDRLSYDYDTGADVDWYVKAEDIVLKNKGNQNAGSPQNHTPQGQPKK